MTRDASRGCRSLAGAQAAAAAGDPSPRRGSVYDPAMISLAGRQGLVAGIANGQSSAWGCAEAFRSLGAELAVTCLNDKARPQSSRWRATSMRCCCTSTWT